MAIFWVMICMSRQVTEHQQGIKFRSGASKISPMSDFCICAERKCGIVRENPSLLERENI